MSGFPSSYGNPNVPNNTAYSGPYNQHLNYGTQGNNPNIQNYGTQFNNPNTQNYGYNQQQFQGGPFNAMHGGYPHLPFPPNHGSQNFTQNQRTNPSETFSNQVKGKISPPPLPPGLLEVTSVPLPASPEPGKTSAPPLPTSVPPPLPKLSTVAATTATNDSYSPFHTSPHEELKGKDEIILRNSKDIDEIAIGDNSSTSTETSTSKSQDNVESTSLNDLVASNILKSFEPATKKINMPCLSKEAAKKRLKAFSANTAMIKDRSKLINPLVNDDQEEKETIVKKTKKKEKEQLPFIKQIINDEKRIRGALPLESNLTHLSQYYVDISIDKLEAKGRYFKERVKENQLREEEKIKKEEKYRKEDRQKKNERHKRAEKQQKEDKFRNDERQRKEDKHKREDKQKRDEKYRREEKYKKEDKLKKSESQSKEDKFNKEKDKKLNEEKQRKNESSARRKSRSKSRERISHDKITKRDSSTHKDYLKKEKKDIKDSKLYVTSEDESSKNKIIINEKDIFKKKNDVSLSHREDDDGFSSDSLIFSTNLKLTENPKIVMKNKLKLARYGSSDTEEEQTTKQNLKSFDEKVDIDQQSPLNDNSTKTDSYSSNKSIDKSISADWLDDGVFNYLPNHLESFLVTIDDNKSKIINGSLVLHTVAKPSVSYSAVSTSGQLYLSSKEMLRLSSDDAAALFSAFKSKSAINNSNSEAIDCDKEGNRSWYKQNWTSDKISKNISHNVLSTKFNRENTPTSSSFKELVQVPSKAAKGVMELAVVSKNMIGVVEDVTEASKNSDEDLEVSQCSLDEEYEAFMSVLSTEETKNQETKEASSSSLEKIEPTKRAKVSLEELSSKTNSEIRTLISEAKVDGNKNEKKKLQKYLREKKKEKKKLKKEDKKLKKEAKKKRKELMKSSKVQSSNVQEFDLSTTAEELRKNALFIDEFSKMENMDLSNINLQACNQSHMQNQLLQSSFEISQYTSNSSSGISSLSNTPVAEKQYSPSSLIADDEAYDPANADSSLDMSLSPSAIFSPKNSPDNDYVSSPYSPSSPVSSESDSPQLSHKANDSLLDIRVPQLPPNSSKLSSLDAKQPVEAAPVKEEKVFQPVTFKLSTPKQAPVKVLTKTLPGFLDDEETSKSFSMKENEEFFQTSVMKQLLPKTEIKLDKKNKETPSITDVKSFEEELRKSSEENLKKSSDSSPKNKSSPRQSDEAFNRRSKNSSRSPTRRNKSPKRRSQSRRRDSDVTKSPLNKDKFRFKRRGNTPDRDKRRSRSKSPPRQSGSRDNRNVKSKSPPERWKRIRSPLPKKYKEVVSDHRDDYSKSRKRRNSFDKDTPSKSSRLSPPPPSAPSNEGGVIESISRIPSPPRAIDTLSRSYPLEQQHDWEWAAANSEGGIHQASEYRAEIFDEKHYEESFVDHDMAINNDNNQLKSLYSPDDSPKRLSLSERLRDECGVEDEDSRQNGANFWSNNNSHSSSGNARVIRVGNVLEVLPQDSPEKDSNRIGPTGNVIEVVRSSNSLIESYSTSGATSFPMGTECPANIPLPSSTAQSIPTPSNSSIQDCSSTTEGGDEKMAPIAFNLQGPHHYQSGSESHQRASIQDGQTPQTISTETFSQHQALISAAVAATAANCNIELSQLLTALQQQNMIVTNKSQEADLVQPQQPHLPAIEPEPSYSSAMNSIDLKELKKQRKERKEKKMREREARRMARREKALQKKYNQDAKDELSDEDDDAIIKEAITEVPEYGSPIPDYEVFNDEEEDEPQTEKPKPPPVILPPPEKGILLGPRFSIKETKKTKSVSFADGIIPGDGSSASEGEEVHSSPPPPTETEVEKKEVKKIKKKEKIRVKPIKQFIMGANPIDSPPPPPKTPMNGDIYKLYPGCTHYTSTGPGTIIICAQQTSEIPNGATHSEFVNGIAGGTVSIPPGMMTQPSPLVHGIQTSESNRPFLADVPYPGYPFPFYSTNASPIIQNTATESPFHE